MSTVEQKVLPLTLEPEPAHFPAIHYVFIEKQGSIPANAGMAWTELHAKRADIEKHNQITGYLSLYKMSEGIYRAGVALAAPPQQLPEGFEQVEFPGGKYRKFLLRGPYAQLGPATGQAVGMAREMGFKLRDDFNIENYVTDPRVTPESELLTEILFPIE